MKTIKDCNFKNRKALIRVDINVPLNEQFEVTDDTRIQSSVPTIKKILQDGGSVILMSHLGRPKGGPEEKFSLKHTLSNLEKNLGQKVHFADDCIGDASYELSANLKAGEVLLLENLRFYKEEEGGDVAFAQKLSKHGDFYVNDAFGTAHRAHASTAVIAQFFPNDKAFGYLMENEISNVSKVLNATVKPVTAIVGGAKVSSKILILKNLLPKVNNIIIGGGMAYTFIKAKGGKVGKSLVEDDKLELALEILKEAESIGVNIVLPSDSVNADAFSNEANISISDINCIPENLMGLDVGPNTLTQFKEVILNSKIILWNGPVGVFEMESFANGTIKLGEMLVEATQKGTFTLVGGGDSVAAAKQFGIDTQLSYISTGGGAMLEYLEGNVLPGVAAILE